MDSLALALFLFVLVPAAVLAVVVIRLRKTGRLWRPAGESFDLRPPIELKPVPRSSVPVKKGTK